MDCGRISSLSVSITSRPQPKFHPPRPLFTVQSCVFTYIDRLTARLTVMCVGTCVHGHASVSTSRLLLCVQELFGFPAFAFDVEQCGALEPSTYGWS